MLDSIPVPYQAIAYLLIGAAIVAALDRILPDWICRLLSGAAAIASLASLWSLTDASPGRIELFWEPLNFFRTSPTLYADNLSLLAGASLTGMSVVMALGMREGGARRISWHGVLLVTLAGYLILTMGANLLTLALGSALIDLMLVILVLLRPVGAASSTQHPLVATIPGIVSTLLLFLSALRMDARIGHTSLLAQNLPTEALTLVGLAGVFRLLVFPLHPRGWDTPQGAASLLLPVGGGIYLLARVQVLAPTLVQMPWLLTIGGAALLAGALLSWTSSAAGPGEFWPSMLAYQVGYALAFLVVLGGNAPWPLLALAWPLGVLAILWEGSLTQEVARARWVVWLGQRIGPWWTKVRAYGAERLPLRERWPESGWRRYAAIALTVLALASLGGAPLTLGARVRWPFYATLLHEGEPLLLLVLVADTLVAAALWTRLGSLLGKGDGQPPRPSALLAAAALLVPASLLGIAPLGLNTGVELRPIALPSVSAWGLGLLFVLPWLLGAWLARVRSRLERHLGLAWQLVNLDWLYRAIAWLVQRLVGAIHWLGRVGEGEGWWGWALVILALGIIFLATH
jgi:hypothetical protein